MMMRRRMMRSGRVMRMKESAASDDDRFRDWETGRMVNHITASAQDRRAPARRMRWPASLCRCLALAGCVASQVLVDLHRRGAAVQHSVLGKCYRVEINEIEKWEAQAGRLVIGKF